MLKPYWLKVLEHFENRRYIENGLTIPFLIGSGSITNPQQEAINLEKFFTQIVDSNLSKIITIMKCDHIDEYIIGTLDQESNQIRLKKKKEGNPIYTEYDNFIITDDSFKNLSSLKEISDKLLLDYNTPIQNQHYSLSFGNWGPYSEKDICRVKEVTI